jgi:hypothetical protein
MKKEARRLCVRDVYMELDIVNSHPTLLLEINRLFGYDIEMPCLKHYINNRQEMLEKIARIYGCDKGAVKKLFLIKMNGGSLSKWKTEFNKNPYVDDSDVKTIMNKLDSEIDALIGALLVDDNLKLFNDCYRYIKSVNEEAERLGKEDDIRRHPLRSAMAIFAQDVEGTLCQLIERYLRFREIESIAYINDSLLVRPTAGSFGTDPSIIDDVQRYIKHTTGFNIELSFKSMIPSEKDWKWFEDVIKPVETSNDPEDLIGTIEVETPSDNTIFSRKMIQHLPSKVWKDEEQLRRVLNVVKNEKVGKDIWLQKALEHSEVSEGTLNSMWDKNKPYEGHDVYTLLKIFKSADKTLFNQLFTNDNKQWRRSMGFATFLDPKKVDGATIVCHNRVSEVIGDNNDRICLCQSCMSSGKTHLAIKVSKGIKRVLVLSMRQTFAMEKSDEYNIPSYLDYTNDLSKLKTFDRLVISLESIHKLKGCKPFDLVIMDESESLLRQINSATMTKHFNANLLTLSYFLVNAKRILMLDAFMSERSLEIMDQLIKVWKKNGEEHSSNVIINTYKPSKGIVREYGYNIVTGDKKGVILRTNQWLNTLFKDLHGGKKVYLVCSSKKMVNNVFNLTKKEFKYKKIKKYTSDSTQSDKNDFKKVNEAWKYDLVMVTSVVTVGINFTEKWFDKCYVYFGNGGSVPRDCSQALGRVRQTNDNIIESLVLPRMSFTSPQILRHSILRRERYADGQVMRVLADVYVPDNLDARIPNEVPWYEFNNVYTQYEDNLSIEFPQETSEAYYRQSGYEIEYIPPNYNDEDGDGVSEDEDDIACEAVCNYVPPEDLFSKMYRSADTLVGYRSIPVVDDEVIEQIKSGEHPAFNDCIRYPEDYGINKDIPEDLEPPKEGEIIFTDALRLQILQRHYLDKKFKLPTNKVIKTTDWKGSGTIEINKFDQMLEAPKDCEEWLTAFYFKAFIEVTSKYYKIYVHHLKYIRRLMDANPLEYYGKKLLIVPDDPRARSRIRTHPLNLEAISVKLLVELQKGLKSSTKSNIDLLSPFTIEHDIMKNIELDYWKYSSLYSNRPCRVKKGENLEYDKRIKLNVHYLNVLFDNTIGGKIKSLPQQRTKGSKTRTRPFSYTPCIPKIRQFVKSYSDYRDDNSITTEEELLSALTGLDIFNLVSNEQSDTDI